MHEPMVIRIRDKSGQSVTDLKNAGLTIDVSANKPKEYELPFSNFDDYGHEPSFGGYYYVPTNEEDFYPL